MKNNKIRSLILVFGMLLLLSTVLTFAILRASGSGSGTIRTAKWSVSRNYSQTGDSIEIYQGGATDRYTLTVQSASEVDVLYKIIISNLPTGVEVDIDNTGYLTPTAGTLIIENANTVINYNDSVKTKTHTLTFKAASTASLVTDREINIDVEFRQDV
jgi:hypothetical protein